MFQQVGLDCRLSPVPQPNSICDDIAPKGRPVHLFQTPAVALIVYIETETTVQTTTSQYQEWSLVRAHPPENCFWHCRSVAKYRRIFDQPACSFSKEDMSQPRVCWR